MLKDFAEKIGLVAIEAGVDFAITALTSYPLMLLWNWLMPLIFGLKTITFLEALGLSLMFMILFKPSSSTSKK
jgi:uncharacterized RDD family membrane protein YckC